MKTFDDSGLPRTDAVAQTAESSPSADTASQASGARSIFIAVSCYAIWGVLPLYWKLIDHVNPLETLAHRLLWSAVFLVPICLVVCRSRFLALFRERRAVLILLSTGLIITLNWGLFIFAVTTGHVVEVAMGYYINPLMNVVVGLVLFKERLTLMQKIALALATLGVVYFAVDYGSFPWISLALAASFATYGALKKIGGYPALPALAVETTLAAPLAVAYVAVAFFMPGHAFFALDASGVLTAASLFDSSLLICGGIVTFIPLLLFAQAVNAIPYSWMGFLQFLSPTLSLLLGVFAFGEAFTHAHVVCFALIWLGLLLIIFESIVKRRGS